MPKSQGLPPNSFKNVTIVATDMDGTLTHHGRFNPHVIQALQDLAAANISVIIVTGRSAGWVSGLVSYLPVAGAIAENGGLYFAGGDRDPEPLVPLTDLTEHRRELAAMFRLLQAKFPQIQESTDNRYRLTDWTFDVQGISSVELEHMRDRCHAKGWGFTYSTVQCHIKLPQQDKAPGLLKILQRHFPQHTVNHVVTVGDSPNDESLFSEQFSLSVGVANVTHYLERLTHHPRYLTHKPESDGFCELTQAILADQ